MHKINLNHQNIASRQDNRDDELVASSLPALHTIIIMIIKASEWEREKGGLVTMYDDEAQNYNNLCICAVQYDGTAQY